MHQKLVNDTVKHLFSLSTLPYCEAGVKSPSFVYIFKGYPVAYLMV
jgi:hypothetical protein